MYDLAQLSTLDAVIATLVAVIAFAYASVGLGGGTAYVALFVISGYSVVAIPTLSLSLNLVVATVGSLTFLCAGHVKARLTIPFLVGSLPLAYLGGSLTLSANLFRWLLLLSLLALLPLLLAPKRQRSWQFNRVATVALAVAIGSVLGFLAGAAGFGGGIYLAPLIIVLGLGTPQQAAAGGAIFIWFTSVSGLVARVQYQQIPWEQIGLFALAALLGGSIGARLGATVLSAQTLEKWLTVIVLFAALILARDLFYAMP